MLFKSTGPRCCPRCGATFPKQSSSDTTIISRALSDTGQLESVKNDPEHTGMVAKLLNWADSFKIRDTWLLDAALYTMNQKHIRWEDEVPYVYPWDNWLYIGSGPHVLHLKTEAQEWLPLMYGGKESWEQFSSRGLVTLSRNWHDTTQKRTNGTATARKK